MPDRPWPAGPILRDIVRAGIAGLVVGLVVGGLGGRLVMRLAALLVPGAEGATTEAGFVVGRVTIAGTRELVPFAGLFSTVVLATVWAVIAPWLPRRVAWRGFAAIPVAVGLGSFALVQADNIDFVILGHDPRVVALLLALVALTAPAMAVTDAWLDGRLPRPASPRSPWGIVYALLAAAGAALAALVAIGLAVSPGAQPLGVTILGTGLVTLAWWYRRLGGQTEPSRPMRLAGGAVLAGGTALGWAMLAPELAGALGID